MAYHAEILLDSLAPSGVRLTTMRVCYPLIIHAEFCRHRVISRSVSSNRAIPTLKIIDMVQTTPYIPEYWGKNKRGMQSDEELSEEEIVEARRLWLEARDQAVKYALSLSDPCRLGVHKQIVNRLLGPFQWVTEIISSTDWQNFFRLRCHSDAQLEIRKIAEMVRDLYNSSKPIVKYKGELHLPLIRDDEWWMDKQLLCKISAARCARTSYVSNTTQKISTPEEDLKLFDRLMGGDIIHVSPTEHIATASDDPNLSSGNFRGWVQYRYNFPNHTAPELKYSWEDFQP
jgi:hypothetical protein